MTAVHRGLVSLVPLVFLAGCIHPRAMRPGADRSGGTIYITQGQIERCGAHNAWEALQRLAPQFTFREDRNGQPSTLERQGHTSILLSDAPRIFLDGTEVADFRSLNQLAANTLASIEILSALDGTTYYGSNAVSGVILIRTKNGS